MLQHQIVQSPARLGLSNPTSPSLQNPTPTPPKFPSSQTPPPSQHNQNQSNLSTTTSSALLSLLPPLPRAQSILLQMASLASKLFEVSPNRALWLTAFRGSIPTFLSSQSQHSPHDSSSSSSPSSTKEILIQFTTLQTQLFEAVAELQEILDLQDAKVKLSREIRAKDSAILAFANKLKDAERVLDVLVDDYSDYRRPKRGKVEDGGADDEDNGEDSSRITTVSTQLKLSDILSYAHRISYTTFAPPEFGANQAPLRGALPPAPQDEQLRASQLYSFADLDVGLPKIVDTREKTIEPMIEPPPPPADTNPLSNLPGIQGLLPPNITVPSGWKPGMPVELPTDLASIVPPPGWKPGDPVSLPPLDSLPLPPKMLEQPLRPIPPQGLQRQPETIQVRHVQLDILDQDDDSSDYTSDEGSSDDDE
ncbi:mediator of RNA polymerase II transcription subunit 4 [Tripterygium wilfordii]|uniref:Mediator of RNA polymerase II transcription subunit 4 n=1 Tax=Tripterygium wilfordii TaxID=458696 RepID=A0A7J7CUL9_TRIWF|nr:mediator of RNA polymerase II transcription subunit 4 [Tripterygium wilfordii]KAF5737586.1 mediator of RNA polymerase II transcription subunit 4 [Tripterygium wilfordii]